jgi:putative heme-binding domain-containing protein
LNNEQTRWAIMNKALSKAALAFLLIVAGGFALLRIYVLAAPPATLSASKEDTDRPYGIAARVPWTTSRLTGSPEPPQPYRSERMFPKLLFCNPLACARFPGLDRFVVCEQAGKLYTFPNDPNCTKPDLFLDLTSELKTLDPKVHKGIDPGGIGLAFHPKFAENRYCYIFYVLNSNNGERLADGSRVSRFTVQRTDPPRIDPASEKIVITWLAGGHNGGCLEFGNDGYLYISTGDGGNSSPADGLNTGQDLSDLLASILRIDVDHEDGGKPYAIPSDNPFIKTKGCRPEIWAYGLRNPWKMTFDRPTGDLWVGDVGWQSWEMIYRIQRGGNYGWPVMEGRQPARFESQRGPTPILPPTLDFPHSEAASITGGYVYHGKRYPDLSNAYICGDWVTGKIWATRFQGDKIVSHREIARTGHRVVAFGEDQDGEFYYLHHDEKDGAFYRLVPQEQPDTSASFPRKLSETGLFADTVRQTPAPGVIPFSVNAEQWADFATAERWVALPGNASIKEFDSPVPIPNTYFSAQMHFPKDAVLAKTIALEMVRSKPETRRRLETQILLHDGREWYGYTYQWNDEQTDATLVGPAGAERTFTIPDSEAPGGKRQQTWRFPSRAECLRCHNHRNNGNLAFNALQLDRDHAYGPIVDNQLRTLRHAGILNHETPEPPKRSRSRRVGVELRNPYDRSGDLNVRVRSYLHINCSPCHWVDLNLRCDIPLAEMAAVGVRPTQGTFNIANAAIIAPADPYRSVLYYRISKLGSGRMPHIGSAIVDEEGVRLIHDWIRQLPARAEESVLLDRLQALDRTTPRSGAAGPTDARAAQVAKERAAARGEVIGKLLGTTSGALLLTRVLQDRQLSPEMMQQIIAAAKVHADSQVRDLFERYLPDEQRLKKLGTVIDPARILGLKGDVARGKELFFTNSTVQCKSCHRVGGEGSTLGPDLSAIGKKLDRARILESILEPSKSIEPQYMAYLVETKDGQVYTGILAEKSATQIVLKQQGDKETRIPADKVAVLAPQRNSLMPELLLRDLTAEQVADLLAYLESLK